MQHHFTITTDKIYNKTIQHIPKLQQLGASSYTLIFIIFYFCGRTRVRSLLHCGTAFPFLWETMGKPHLLLLSTGHIFCVLL